MSIRNMMFGLMLVTGMSACKSEQEHLAKNNKIINGKEYSLIDGKTVGVHVTHDPVARFLTQGRPDRKSIYGVADSSVITVYCPGMNNATGGDKRFWRNNALDSVEKAELVQAIEFVRQYRPE